jgi:DNA primase
MEITALLPRLQGVKKTGSGWMARCPAHDDRTASLSISEGSNGRTLLHCHAGCTVESICAKLDLTLADLFPPKDTRNGKRIAATYDYHDRNGKLVFQVVRFEPKDFRQRKPDATAPDGWTWNTKGVDKVLFRLPEILHDIAGGKILFAAEGEKDALVLAELGISATTNPGGAGKWREDYSETLRGCDCVVIADKDKAGREHAAQVATSLHGKAKSVRVIELPDVDGKPVKDAADYFNAGATVEDFIAQVDNATEWTPAIKIEMSEPGEPVADIRGEIVSILTNGKLTLTEQRTRIANAVVKALAGRGRFFYHAERKDYDSAMFFDGERKTLLRIHADAFSAWLADWLAVNRADSVFKYIAAQVETEALNTKRSTAIFPESFWASRAGAIFISCGDGRAVKITPGNVQLVDNGADGVLFAAGNTLAPWTLTESQDPFATCSVFSGANCAASHGLDLLRLWILSLPSNPASKPPLCLAGDVGSGKTRLAKGIAELYGLPFIANKVEDFGEDSFWASLDGGGLFTLDNADTRNKWLPDAVASAATDGCSQRRKLYTNSDRITLRARAWLCMTTANPTFAADSGLADRLLLVRMNRRTDETSDASLSDEIREHRDAGLSFIARTLATALADTQRTPAGLNQRHPDFAKHAVRIGRAIGREAESIHALKSAEDDKSFFCLENDSIATALLSYLANGETFTGTAGELRTKLIETDTDLADKLSVKRLGKRLSMLWPHLEKVLATAKQEKDRNHFTIYTLKTKSADCAEFQTRF